MSPVAQVVRAAEYKVALVFLVLVVLEAQLSMLTLTTHPQPAWSMLFPLAQNRELEAPAQATCRLLPSFHCRK